MLLNVICILIFKYLCVTKKMTIVILKITYAKTNSKQI